MIPKIIHYCWLGGAEKPESVLRCIKSWQKCCPDYEIIEWNESNLDLDLSLYAKQAYEAKAWGFVPDPLRLWIIYTYGGFYLDTDVQLIRSLDGLLTEKCFVGFEEGRLDLGLYVAMGLGFGAEAGNSFIKEHFELYDNLSFINADGSYNKIPSPKFSTDLLKSKGLNNKINQTQKVGEVSVYATEYFCPKSFETGISNITENTYSIHHYDASWFTDEQQAEKKARWKMYKKNYILHIPTRFARKILGEERYNKLKKKLKRR